MSLSRIHCLATGGTIAGASASQATTGYQAGVVGVQALLTAVPELSQIAQLSSEQILAMDSKNMQPTHWIKIAQAAQRALLRDDVDGVVITHGTDTLEETAFFLQLVLKSDKPVVLVAAMRPATALSADGPLNLFDAVCVAAHAGARGKGVMLVMNHLIHSAYDVTKTNTMRPDSFSSPNMGALGCVQDRHVQWLATIEPAMYGLWTIPESFVRVDIVMAYAGMDSSVIDAVLACQPQGIVVAGMGNGAFSDEVRDALAKARQEKIAVLRSTRTGSGYVMPNGDCNDDELGFVSAGLLNPYKARILLMTALSQGISLDELNNVFNIE